MLMTSVVATAGACYLSVLLVAGMAHVKSGWLHRQSTILRRWKKNWFDLWSDGRLVFYDDQNRRSMEDEIHMRVDCINIRSGNACQDLSPPEGRDKDGLLQIVCRDGHVISLCAESGDSALAWTIALQDARINSILDSPQFAFSHQSVIPSAPPLYPDLNPTPLVLYPDQNGGYVTKPPSPAYTGVMYNAVHFGPEHQVSPVIIEERRRRGAGEVVAGLLLGAATGLAIGSIF